jgi:hypothetical protein
MQNIQEYLTEQDLVINFGIPEGKEKSKVIGYWIRDGLKYFDLSGQRVFKRKDVVSFLDKKYDEQHSQRSFSG